MNRNLFYLVGAIGLIAAAGCTSSDEGGEGGEGGSGASGGSGGSGGVACVSCGDWLDSCDPECADPDTICDGAGMTAFETMTTCMCGQCTADCGGTCTDDPGGTDTANCESCLNTAMVGAACSAELADCAAN